MKKIVKLFIILIIVFNTMFLASCNFSFKIQDIIDDIKNVIENKDEDEKKPTWEEVENDEGEKQYLSEYTFEIIDNNFYYPTVKGTLRVKTLPEKFTFTFNNEEREITLTEVVNKNNVYECKFEQVFYYNRINKGNYNYVINYYKDDNIFYKLTEEKEVIVTEDLYIETLYDMESGETIERMDSDSKWTKFY